MDEAGLVELLGRIRDESEGRSEHERSNLARDLGAVLMRLRAGEYLATDFIAPNTFDVPRRTREFFEYMQSLDRLADKMSAVIRPALSAEVGEVGEVGEVIDLCPGRIPKVEMALIRLGFAGNVTLVDKNRAALDDLASLVKVFAPRFTMRAHSVDIFQDTVNASADLVIANHVIDDALIDRHASELGIDVSRIYEEEAALRSAWTEILLAKDRLSRSFPPHLAESLARFVRPAGQLLLTQYAGYVETLLGGEESTAFFLHLFDRTVAELLGRGFEASEIKRPSGERTAALRAPGSPYTPCTP